MGERRNRKSLWDSVEETKHPSGMSERDNWTGKDRHSRHNTGRYHEFSSSGTTPAPKSGDHSGWPAWESIEENPVSDNFIRSRQNAPEGKEIGGENRYYKNVSPGFDGMERRNYDRPPENDRSRPQRYLGRGRSRSRSRSRTRGRSSSLSRGKGRERGRGWSRSRSRSRSRGDGSAGGHARSRSPIGDYRHQSHGWSERRSGPDKSSQICREFAAGRCRRGNQCRLFHPDNVSRRDEDPVEDDGADAWRFRADHGVSKQSHSRSHGFELRDDGSDRYHGEDVQVLNKSRSTVPCKDFIRGNCRWGDNCKFSHHFTTEDGFEKGTRHSSLDDDKESHANKNAKPLCKYFAAGKCDRDNCRFSHENPKLTNLDRRSEVSDDPRFHDKSNRWSGPRRDDITRVSDTVKPTRWSETVVTNMAGTDDTTDGNGDHGRGSSMENERWALPEWTGNSLIREQRQSPPREMGSFGGVMASTESIGKVNMSNEQEHIILHQSQLNQDGTMKVQGQNTIPEDQVFSVTSLPQNISPASHFEQQHQGMVKKNPMNSFGSTVLDEVDSRNTRLPIIFSGQNLNQKHENMFSGHPSSSKGYDIGANMLIPDRSNGFNTDLNGTETHMVVPLDLQSQMPQNQEAIQTLAMSELNAPQTFPYLVTSDQSTMTKSPVAIPGQQVTPATKPMQFLTQRFVNEQSQAHNGTEVSNAMGMMPSFSNTSGHVPFVSVSSAQLNPDTVSRGLLNALDNDGYTSEHMNHNSTGGTEPNSQMLVDQSYTPSVSGMEPDYSKVKLPESTELKPEDPVVDKGIAEENKDIQENKGPSLDGQGKVEDTSANKDNKGMRVFKNALIEFVKEHLKPKWKEGRMSREAHKTIVKKVVDKVTTTIQVDHIPKTQDKVELYLTNSKPKIAKLIEAYAERCQKTES